MQEQWARWEPLDGLEDKYDVDFILDTNDDRGLIIMLYSCKDRNRKLEITFNRYVDSYCHTNESFRINLPYELSAKYSKEFYANWTFFRIANSSYLAWLAHESCNYSKEFNFVHFCLLCPDSVVDIIARYEPTVRYV